MQRREAFYKKFLWRETFSHPLVNLTNIINELVRVLLLCCSNSYFKVRGYVEDATIPLIGHTRNQFMNDERRDLRCDNLIWPNSGTEASRLPASDVRPLFVRPTFVDCLSLCRVSFPVVILATKAQSGRQQRERETMRPRQASGPTGPRHTCTPRWQRKLSEMQKGAFTLSVELQIAES